MQDCKINIMGTEYSITQRNEEYDELLKDKGRDGYTDYSTRKIVICNKKADCEMRDWEEMKRTILRHEILHAFLMESGLDSCSMNSFGPWATNEEMVDWFAIQSPKIFQVYQKLNIL